MNTHFAPVSRQRIDVIDYLRFFAAMGVVSFHWLYSGISNGKVTTMELSPIAPLASYGSLGVNLFFIVSGFVISGSASHGDASRFAAGRAVRLFPAFWAALLITSLTTSIIGGEIFNVSFLQIVANFSMVPQIFGQPPVDGVYWTLTLELAFYAIIFVALFLGLERWLPCLYPAWAFLMLAVSLAAPQLSEGLYAGGYFSYFAGGAILDTIRRSGRSSLLIGGLISAVSVSLIHAQERIQGVKADDADLLKLFVMFALTLLCWALVALTLVDKVAALRLPFSGVLGSLTFPVYLLHAHIGYMTLNLYAGALPAWLLYSIMLFVLIAASWFLHHAVEVRGRQIWLRLSYLIIAVPVAWLQFRCRLAMSRVRSRQPHPS